MTLQIHIYQNENNSQVIHNLCIEEKNLSPLRIKQNEQQSAEKFVLEYNM